MRFAFGPLHDDHGKTAPGAPMFTRDDSLGTNLRLRLYGALDDSGARALRARLAAAALAAQGDLLLDLTGVNFIDDDGLGAVIFLSKQLQARRRRLRLVGISVCWQARFRDLGLGGLVDSTDTPPSPAGIRRRRPGSVH